MEDLLVLVLHLAKQGKITSSEAKKISDSATSILNYLQKKGLVEKSDKEYKLIADFNTIAKELSSKENTEKIEVPFISRIYKATNAYMISIPGYIVRTFRIETGDLLVLRANGVRISGTISGQKKKLFYIHKKYWDKLNIEDREEMEFVLEAIYKPGGQRV